MLRRILYTAVLLLAVATGGKAQIVNHLKVERETYLRYAACRIQPFNAANLAVADSLYRIGTEKGDWKTKAYALHLEFPVRFILGETERADECVQEIRELTLDHKDARTFYLGVIHEWCLYLIRGGRASDAMLEAREMERLAVKEKSALGKLYSYKIIGLIQSERTNTLQATDYFTKALRYCRDARMEQELPNLYLLLAQEYIQQGKGGIADHYCTEAEAFQKYYKTLPLKILMTRAFLYNSRGETELFRECYRKIIENPYYKGQIEADDRYSLDVAYYRSAGLFQQALAAADSLENQRLRHSAKQGIYASLGDYASAYTELYGLMDQKDSIFIRVQNEDILILDAEMKNAQLREEAQRLKAQNQATIFIGFLVMFAIAFMAILLSQWQLRENLEQMRRKNSEMLRSRHNFQKAMEAKEAEVNSKLKLLQNRTTNVLTGYEEFLDY